MLMASALQLLWVKYKRNDFGVRFPGWKMSSLDPEVVKTLETLFSLKTIDRSCNGKSYCMNPSSRRSMRWSASKCPYALRVGILWEISSYFIHINWLIQNSTPSFDASRWGQVVSLNVSGYPCSHSMLLYGRLNTSGWVGVRARSNAILMEDNVAGRTLDIH